MNKISGVTLIELIVVIIILGILLLSSIHMGNIIIVDSRLRSVSEQLKSDLLGAKVEAIRKNSLIIISQIEDQCTDSPHEEIQGWDGGWYYSNQSPTYMSCPRKLWISNNVKSIRFNGIGQPVGGDFIFRITPIFPLKCKRDKGEITCLNVIVTKGGAVKVCNTDPNALDVYRCLDNEL